MISREMQGALFQNDWTAAGERGWRDAMLVPALFFGAVSPGLFIISVFFPNTLGLWIALAMNLVGYGLTHLLYLGRMKRSWRLIFNLKTSWISRGFLFNVMFTFFGGLYALSQTAAVGWNAGAGVTLTLKILGVASAVLFAGYPGFLLSSIKAIPFWRSFLEPVIFFLQGMLGGTALYMILIAFMDSTPAGALLLVKTNFLLAALVLLLLMTALLKKAVHEGAGKLSVAFLLQGRFAFVFIGGVIVGGLILPLGFMTFMLISPFALFAYAPVLIVFMFLELVGIYLAKYSVLKAGAYSENTDLQKAIHRKAG